MLISWRSKLERMQLHHMLSATLRLLQMLESGVYAMVMGRVRHVLCWGAVRACASCLADLCWKVSESGIQQMI